eukprot:g3013.t1
MFRKFDFRFFIFIVALSMEFVIARFSSRRVSSCFALRRAFADQSNTAVEVVGSFVCDTATWPEPVIIERDLNVTGVSIRGVNPQINWVQSSNGVIAGVGRRVLFSNIIFQQKLMGIGGFDVLFFETRENSTACFVSVVIGVESCPQSLQKDRIESLPRPREISGIQRSNQINIDSILIQDVAMRSSAKNAVWYLINTVLACNVYKNDPILNDSYTLVANSRSSKTLGAGLVDPLGYRQDPNSSSSETSGQALTALIAGFGIAAVLAIVALGYVGRKRAQRIERVTETASCHSTVDMENYSTMGPLEVWSLLDTEVTLESILGQGEFGKVYRASWQGTTVAVKIIKHNEQCLRTNVGGLFEAFVAKHISHPNVVQTYQISTKQQQQQSALDPQTPSLVSKGETEGPTDKNELSKSDSSTEGMFGYLANQEPVSSTSGAKYETWIVLEYCDGGSLAEAIRNGELSPGQDTSSSKLWNVAKTALEIAGAMNYLHSVRIIHGDLKPGNVLLKKDASDPRGFICKVCDFGLSKFLAEDSHIETFTCGTVTHMPPELLNEGKLSSASDVYSFGVLLWEILTGKKPFVGKTQPEIILSVVNKQMRPKIPANAPEEFTKLIQSCWNHDYNQRPAFTQIIDILTKILKKYKKMEKSRSGSRPAPDALDTAGTVRKASLFTAKNTGNHEGPSEANQHQEKYQIVPERIKGL